MGRLDQCKRLTPATLAYGHGKAIGDCIAPAAGSERQHWIGSGRQVRIPLDAATETWTARAQSRAKAAGILGRIEAAPV
jgi:hypothetical protein